MFGEVVRNLRTKKMISQEELADRAGISVRQLRNIESGRVAAPRVTTVRLLANGLRLNGPDLDAFQTAARADEDAPAVSEAAGPSALVRPAQLPARVAGFAGRAAELAAISAGDDPIVLVVGAAGVGKTTLLVHWAAAAAANFPDGQLYVNLRGFDPSRAPVDPTDVLHGFLTALGIAGPQVPAGRDGRAALFRSLLDRRRMLVVLDNAADSDQVRPLLPGNAGCRVLVSSRDSLTGLVVSDAARVLPLSPMDTAEARELLTLRLTRQRMATVDDTSVDRLIERCERLPIALALVAARLAANPALTFDGLTAEIDDPARALDGLAVGDLSTDLRAVFSWSYRRLSPPAARLFRLLAVHPGPDISVEAAASLAGVARVRPLLDELVRTHLVREHRPGRYEFHDLLRAYAAELAEAREPAADRTGALLRALDHYVRTAAACARLLLPHRDEVSVPDAPPAVVTAFPADRDAAMEWFTTEHQALLAMLDVATELRFDAYVGPWCQAFLSFATLRGHWRDELRGHRATLTVEERRGDLAGQARGHLGIAVVQLRLTEHADAERHLRLALDLFTRAGDLVGAGHANSNLARLMDGIGRHPEALRHEGEALRLYTEAGHAAYRARALSGYGWYQATTGDHEGALRSGLEALALLRETGDRDGEAATLDTLGYTYGRLGRNAEAVTHYEQAAALHRANGDRYNEALVLSHIGESELALGRLDSARATWTAALAVLTDLEHPDAESLQLRLKSLDRPD
jgi:tetratricopeptide (TPR) repeat protein/transcriptional regulator with XRE-family HTH domain